MLSTVPSNSKAAVVRQFRTPLCIEEVPIPKELEPGAILTRIETCSICGTDVHLWQGSLALKVELPVIIGHEMVGPSLPWDPGQIATPLANRCGRAIASPGRTRPAAHASTARSLRSRRCASTAACTCTSP